MICKANDTIASCHGAQPAYRFTDSLYQYGDDDSTEILTAPSFTVLDNLGNNVGTGNLAPGTYQIVPSGLVQRPSTPKYNIVYQSGTLTVPEGSFVPTPEVTVTNNCDGTSTLSTTAEGSLLWNTGDTTSSITVTEPGDYSVTVTLPGGCTSEAGVGTAAPKTAPNAPLVAVTNNCGNSVLSTDATGSLLWSNGATTSSITVSDAAAYTVTSTTDGCTSLPGSGTSAPKAIPETPV
ncbi:MAG: hypothetical protein QM757_03885, partial [Paludibaculum sp.]